MILVTGGRSSGKRTFVAELGYAPEDCARDLEEDGAVLLDLEGLVGRLLDDGRWDPDASLPAAMTAREVVVCAEVGSGVVPVGRRERLWRDAVGLACNRLAREADCVVRMVCGIPVVLKGTLPARGKS